MGGEAWRLFAVEKELRRAPRRAAPKSRAQRPGLRRRGRAERRPGAEPIDQGKAIARVGRGRGAKGKSPLINVERERWVREAPMVVSLRWRAAPESGAARRQRAGQHGAIGRTDRPSIQQEEWAKRRQGARKADQG